MKTLARLITVVALTASIVSISAQPSKNGKKTTQSYEA